LKLLLLDLSATIALNHFDRFIGFASQHALVC